MALTPGQTSKSATNQGQDGTPIKALPDPEMGDQDVRDFPSNGAIPDEIRSLVAPRGFHVP